MTGVFVALIVLSAVGGWLGVVASRTAPIRGAPVGAVHNARISPIWRTAMARSPLYTVEVPVDVQDEAWMTMVADILLRRTESDGFSRRWNPLGAMKVTLQSQGEDLAFRVQLYDRYRIAGFRQYKDASVDLDDQSHCYPGGRVHSHALYEAMVVAIERSEVNRIPNGQPDMAAYRRRRGHRDSVVLAEVGEWMDGNEVGP